MHFVLWFVLGWIPAVIAEYRGHRFGRIVGTAGFIALWFHWIAWVVVVAFALIGPTRPESSIKI